ncbi:MAG: KpsF/GutQ family sugar-phosphate isomerase [Bacteroidales bacterium]|nr:KpsF/GutQ family sugar-phosphate isomerase [Bacteroidales bacterium]
MKTAVELKDIANQVFACEKNAVVKLAEHLDNNFPEAVKTLFLTKGRVIITGIGKSANIANKIVSTLNSTGTPAIFMHAADAIHGDLGIIQPDDVVICISKSGNTPEIKVLIPLIKNTGNTLIAIVGNTESYLASQADIVLNTTVDCEADPNNLAPTASTTAQLVMGDALAVALLECRRFSANDFAKYHPGGALGKQLYMRVSDIYKNNERPIVPPAASISDTILEMTGKRLGCTVVGAGGTICGIITDGDLRRMLKSNVPVEALKASDIMSQNPKTVLDTDFAANALSIMRHNSITQLVVTDTAGQYLGIIHLHDLLREGIV